MITDSRKTDKPRRETIDLTKRSLRGNGSGASFFSRLSVNAPASRGTLGGAKATGRATAPGKARQKTKRPDQEVIIISSSSDGASHITVSSDSPSHISISSDSVAVVSEPNKPMDGSKTASISPRILRPRIPRSPVQNTSVRVPPSPVSQPRTAAQSQASPPRRRRQPVVKPQSFFKRKYDFDSDSDVPPPTDIVRVPSLWPSTSRMLPVSKSPSSSFHHGPFAPKDNVPLLLSRSNSSRKPSPPKRARLSPPADPVTHPPSSGHDADVEELIPSSQSDEQELSPPRLMKKDPTNVKESVDKWRREALVQPTSPQQTSPSLESDFVCTEDDLPSLGDDLGRTDSDPASPGDDLILPPDSIAPSRGDPDYSVDVPMDVDVSIEVPLPDATRDASVVPGIRTPRSETEVSIQLWPHSSGSTLSSARKAAAIHATIAAPSTLPTSTSSPLLKTISPPAFSSSDMYRSLTPPTSDPVPSPTTPEALDVESKTAKIIAEIRAKAFAAAPSSPEDEPLEFKELDDSSSDDSDDGFFTSRKVDKGKGKAVATPVSIKKSDPFDSPLSNLGSSRHSKQGHKRYNLRRHSPTHNRDLKPTLVTVSDSAKRKPLRKSTNPLEALLKEKKLADKKGKGIDALRAAEEAAASSSKLKRAMMLEMDGEEDLDVEAGWADEDAALQVVRQGARGLTLKSSSPVPADGDDDSDRASVSEEGALEEGDYQKILGEKDGKAVGKILASDRRVKDAKVRGKKRERILGVPFWDSSQFAVSEKSDDNMQVDRWLPSLPFGKEGIGGHPLLTMLWDAVERNDLAQVSALLTSGMLVCIEPQQFTSLLPWLWNLAMSPVETSLSEPSYHLLCQSCTSRLAANNPSGFSFSLVLNTLKCFGAKADVLNNVGWDVTNVRHEAVGMMWRAEAIFRLVALTTIFADSRAIPLDDIPDVMLSLLLIALDMSTSLELKRNIMIAVEALGQTIPSGTDGLSSIEVTACSMIVNFAHNLAPINKAHLLSFIVGGCLQTERMARWIARSLLLNTVPPTADSYTSLPSLSPIMTLLSPPSGSEAIFDIQSNSEKNEYYDDLANHLDVLSKALTNVDDYVTEEKQTSRHEPDIVHTGNTDDGSKQGANREKSSPPLEQIRILLDGLHGKIVDTRAAHLDRSRAKAALQRLSFRIHYQRTASLRPGNGTGKPRNLHSYFASPKK
ncbi:hypothetical protein AcW1_009108 [Taiwanofungus camphoratus]|nr:hypothetical protein AcW1_009108 [Antrodia cinnamomea]